MHDGHKGPLFRDSSRFPGKKKKIEDQCHQKLTKKNLAPTYLRDPRAAAQSSWYTLLCPYRPACRSWCLTQRAARRCRECTTHRDPRSLSRGHLAPTSPGHPGFPRDLVCADCAKDTRKPHYGRTPLRAHPGPCQTSASTV